MCQTQGSHPGTTNPHVQPQQNDLVSRLDKLNELHKTGAITSDEYITAKNKILSGC